MILITLLILPLIGVLLIAPSYRNQENAALMNISGDPDTKLKTTALTISIITFLYSLSLLVLFDPTTPDYQFTYQFGDKNIFSSDFQIGIDGISLYFVILTTFLFPISFLASWKISSSPLAGGNKYNVKFYLCTMLILEVLLG